MKKKFFAVLCVVLTSCIAHAQLTGVKNIPGNYATLAAAITDLNTQGVGAGGVTLNLLAGNPQTAPVGGYMITAQGTAANPIIFNGNNNTITAPALIANGSSFEGIIKIVGGDYITLRQFTLQENPANTTVASGSNNMTEWGIALLHSSPTNGAQNNTITNNTISLNKNYSGSLGIYTSALQQLNATSPEDITNNSTAPNNSNSIQGNAISNVNVGIVCIGSTTAANMDQLNVIDGNNLTNFGGLTVPGVFPSVPTFAVMGIYINNENNYTVSNNLLVSAPVSGTSGILAIYANYTAVTAGTIVNTITGNSITFSQAGNSSTAAIYTDCAGLANNVTLNIISNTILNCSCSSSASFNGMMNYGAFGFLNITGNIFRDNVVTGSSGFTGIRNGGFAYAINITNNQVGGPAGGAVQMGAGGTGAFIGIYNQAAASTASLTITGNNFEGITYAGLASGLVAIISNPAAESSQNISSNTFTNLNLNTSGTCAFISNNNTLPAGGSVVVNSNSIVTGFTKAAGGTVTLFQATSGSSPVGSTKSAQNNNFSNITLTGATPIIGWQDTEGAAAEGPTKTISNNIFSNWNVASSAPVIQMDNGGSNSSVSGNSISFITSSGSVTGIILLSNNRGNVQTILNNTVSNLTCTGSQPVTAIESAALNVTTVNITGNTVRALRCVSNANFGIRSSLAGIVNITSNKISDIESATGSTLGILVGNGTFYVANNLVGDLRVLNSTNETGIVGIYVNGATDADINSNTVYLNASSATGAGSSGIYALTSTPLTLRNNLLVNLSVANAGLHVVAYRLSTTTLTSYAAASNNNSFYAGTPSATHLIFYDGTNSDQTLAAYKIRVATRDAASVTTNPAFASVIGTSPVFLHIPAATPTLLESGGVAIAGFTTDYDNDVRPGPVGSVNGGGIVPDIGADEFDGIIVCSGTPTAGTASNSPLTSCGPRTFTLSLAGQSTVGVSYQWQSSTTAGGPYTNLAGGTTVPFITGSISTTTYFVCVITCSTSGLTATSNEVTGTIYTPVSGTTVVTNVACFGGSNGAINLTPSGTPGYTFNWLPSGPTTEDRTGLAAGTYSVQITDVNGCTGTVTATVTQPTTPVSGTTVVTNVACFGGSNGAINLTPTGGSGGYTFNWLPSGPTTEDRTGLTAGTYSVQITDVNGCTVTVTATVTQPTTPVSGTTVVTNVACFGGSNGSIDLTPSGGTPGYTYNWGGGITTQDRTGLAAATYAVIITDANGCIGTMTITVTQPTSPVSGTTVVTNVSCFGGSNGSINLTPSGGSGGYTFNWLPSGPTTEDRTGLTAGTYSVQITDVNGCTGTVTATVTQPPAISVTASAQTNVSCFGGNNGAASINAATGGTGTKTYNWTPGNPTGDGTTSVTGLTAGTWTVTTTDGNGCTATNAFTVTQPPAISVTASAQTNVSCFGGSNGAASINAATGGSGSFSYNWTPGNPTGDGTTSVTGLTAGTWTVTTTDGNGCTATNAFTVTQPPAISVTASAQTNVSCFGGSNGAASINAATGGSGSFTYNWTPGNPTGDGTTSVSGLTASTWTVTTTDGNGCTAMNSFTITQPPAISVTASAQTNVSCFGGSNGAASINAATGGAGSFTYNWTPGNPTGDGTTSVSGLTAGTWTVTTTDLNGCTATNAFTVTQPPAISVTASAQTNVSCFGGSNGAASINAATGGAGSFTYNWTPGNPTGDGTTSVSGLTAGTWTVTTTDGNGCTATNAFTVTQPPAISVTASAQTNVSCFGGSNGAASINAATGGAGSFTYNWTPGTPTGDGTTSVSGLAAGTWIVTTTDINGCTAMSSFTVTQPPAISVTASAQTNVSCFGGSNGAASINAATGGSGSFTYNWTPGNPTGDGTTSVSGLTAGTWTVTTTDLNGCTATNAFTVTQPPAISVTASAQTNVSCFGGSNGAASINAATGGAGSFTYNWTPGNPTGDGTTSVSGLAAGTWTVTTTDLNGCTATNAFTITQPPAISMTAASQTNVSCFGGSNGAFQVNAALGGTGAFTYDWTPGNPTGDGTTSVTGLTAGTWTVTATDANGCSATINFTITEPPAISLTAASQTNVSCFGGNNGAFQVNAALGGTGAFTYDWTPGNPTGDGTTSVSGLTEGIWTVIATDANGCTATVGTTITAPPSLIAFTMTPPISCNGGTTTVTVIGFGGTSPYTGTGTFTVTAGTYSYIVMDANGCATGTSATVTEPTAVIATSATTPILCNGGNATVTVTASGGTSPYTGEGTFTVTAGTYSYPVTDANGCATSTSVTVTEPTLLTSASSATAILCNGGNATVAVTASGGTSPYTGDGTFTETAGTYTYTVTDANGCASSTSVTITEPTALAATSSATTILCNGGTSTVTVAASGGTSPYTGEGTFTQFAGTYSYTVTDNNGCTSTSSIVIAEPSVLSASVNNTVNPTTCGGTDGSIDINVTGGTTYYSFLWSNGNPTEDIAGIAAGAYSVTVTDANGCTTTVSASINDPGAPTVTLSLSVDTACGSFPGLVTLSGETPVGGTFSGTAVTGTTFDPFAAGMGMHYITYSYTDVNGCTGNATDSIQVEACIGIETIATTAWNLFPNPTSGVLSITTTAALNSDVIVEVYAADGKLIRNENKQQSTILSVDISAEPVGVYFIRITANDKTTMHRVVKI